MLVLVLRTRALRSLASQAVRDLETRVQTAALSELGACLGTGDASPCLVLHDFSPDAAASVELLNGLRSAGHEFAVFGLLAPPATSVLDALCRLPLRFSLVGMAIAGEDGPDRLCARVRDALQRGGRRVLLDIVVSTWRLDPLLADLAERELTDVRPPATLSGLLREAGVSRKRFVGVTRRQGVSPPLRFLQGLRVLRAADLLQQGCSTRHTAERLGYGSLDTLRRHFHALAGITPAAARARPLQDLAASLRLRGGDIQRGD